MTNCYSKRWFERSFGLVEETWVPIPTCGLFGTTNFWNPKKLDWDRTYFLHSWCVDQLEVLLIKAWQFGCLGHDLQKLAGWCMGGLSFYFYWKNVARYLYSKDTLLDDHENELQEQGYCEDERHHPKFHVSSLILYSILLPTSALNFFHWFNLAKMISYVLPFNFNTLTLNHDLFIYFNVGSICAFASSAWNVEPWMTPYILKPQFSSLDFKVATMLMSSMQLLGSILASNLWFCVEHHKIFFQACLWKL